MTKELLRRGIDTHLYAVSSTLTDNDYIQEVSGYRSVARKGFTGRLLTAMEFRAKRVFRRYDLELRNVAGELPQLGLKATKSVPYYHGMELAAGYVKPQRGFFSTPNMQPYATRDSILLPRCVNLDLFRKGRSTSRERDSIRVGHFWRRGSINADFAFRYFKGTDLLEEALAVLRGKGFSIEYVDKLVPRAYMPRILSSLDVLADQFVTGIYGLPAVEALLVGVPVVGYYKEEYCESSAVYESLVNVKREPESIAQGIISATKSSPLSVAKEITEFHSPRHSVETFLDAGKRWNLF